MSVIDTQTCAVLEQLTQACATTTLDAYEAAVRALTEIAWSAARSGSQPISTLTRGWADLTRDSAAVQLSTTRWILDL